MEGLGLIKDKLSSLALLETSRGVWRRRVGATANYVLACITVESYLRMLDVHHVLWPLTIHSIQHVGELPYEAPAPPFLSVELLDLLLLGRLALCSSCLLERRFHGCCVNWKHWIIWHDDLSQGRILLLVRLIE